MSNFITAWIDHNEARLVHIRTEGVTETTVSADPLPHHKHPKGPEGAKDHPEDTKRFFADVTRALAGTDQVLLVGPSNAKLEFASYIHDRAPVLAKRIVGIATLDHPTRGQLVAHARRYFGSSEPRWGIREEDPAPMRPRLATPRP